MEWMLQVVDEVDDAIGAVRHRWLGLNAEIGAVVGSGVALAAMGAAFAVGRDAGVVCAVAVMASVGTAVQVRSARAGLRR